VLLAGREKGQQAQPLRGDGREVLAPDRLVERGDDEGCSWFVVDRLPACANKTVDQDRALHDPVAAEEAEVLAGRHDPRAVGVGEKDVVVVGQEAHGDGGVCRGTG
jgi:hypothetical protein